MSDDLTPEQTAEIRRAAAISAALCVPLTDLFARINHMAARREPLEPALRLQLEGMQQDAYQMLRAVNSLGVCARVSGGENQWEPILLWGVLSRCMKDASALLAVEKRQLKYRFPETDEVVLCDEDSLCTALLHLISNAFEAYEEGGSVTVTGSVIGGSAVITVVDQGRGIPSEHLGEVFEAFRSRDSADLPYQSLGTGLPLARGVIESCGGSIRLLSDEGGTRVVCTLPVAAPGSDLPLRSEPPSYLENRFSPLYIVLCGLIRTPWPYKDE